MIRPRRIVVDRLVVRSVITILAGGVCMSVEAQSLLDAPLPAIGNASTPAQPVPAEMQAEEVLVPLPPRRPVELGGGRASEPHSPVAGDDCLAELRATGAEFETVGSPATGNSACRIATPIRLSALPVPEGGIAPLSLPDKPVIACRLALAFEAWTKEVAPGLAASRGAPLVSITTGPGWECRTRNRQPGAPLSNHANGLAVDVNTFFFANKARLSVSGGASDPAFRTVRAAACRFFTTVLGPGSDGFHEGHLHVDALPRRAGRFGIYCH